MSARAKKGFIRTGAMYADSDLSFFFFLFLQPFQIRESGEKNLQTPEMYHNHKGKISSKRLEHVMASSP